MFNTLWYDNLIKPLLTPPAWIFSTAWIILYCTILISLILYVIKITKKDKLYGYTIFIVHMVFNLLWSPVFFVLHKMDIALTVLLIIIFTAILLIKTFFHISKIAAYIFIPYFIWLLFALYLNIEFIRLN